MNPYFQLSCICVIAITVIGCGKQQSSPAPVSPAAAKTSAEPRHTGTQEPVVAAATTAAKDTPPRDLSSEPPGSVGSRDLAPIPPTPNPPEPKPPRRTRPWSEIHGDPARIYLPTAEGPLIVDAHIRMDGQDQQKLFHDQIDKVIADASADTDRPLDWMRLFRFTRDDPERFGTVMQNAGNQTRELIRRYDGNRNDRVDHGELVRFLFRESRDNVAFRVRGTEYYRNHLPSRSNLFSLLDSDHDDGLSTVEAENLAGTLLRFDLNSDRQLALDEVQSEMPDDDEVWDQRSSSRHGNVAMDFEGFVDWNLVSYSLDSMRERAPFGAATNPIVSLDANADGTTSPDEARHIVESDPHVRLVIEFKHDEEPTLQILDIDPEIDEALVTKRHQPGQLVIADQSLQLVIQVVDRYVTQERIPATLFRRFDANFDGFLDETEIPDPLSSTFSFNVLDGNGDGRLSLREINQRESTQLPIWGYQVRGRAAEFPDQLFGWLDRNHDGRLSSREIDSAGERIGVMSDEASFLRRSELPTTYTVRFIRGNPQQDANSFRRSVHAAKTDRVPAWATEMDINKDGDISRSEFIGTKTQFDQLDEDNDGFLEPSETSD